MSLPPGISGRAYHFTPRLSTHCHWRELHWLSQRDHCEMVFLLCGDSAPVTCGIQLYFYMLGRVWGTEHVYRQLSAGVYYVRQHQFSVNWVWSYGINYSWNVAQNKTLASKALCGDIATRHRASNKCIISFSRPKRMWTRKCSDDILLAIRRPCSTCDIRHKTSPSNTGWCNYSDIIFDRQLYVYI